MLLEKGAQVDMGNIDGLSALYLAVKDQHTESVKVLFQHGAKVTVEELHC